MRVPLMVLKSSNRNVHVVTAASNTEEKIDTWSVM